MKILFRSMVVSVSLLALAPPAGAQQGIDELPPAKFEFGPLGLTPKLVLKDIGVDTNPLNRPGDPKQDFTTTIGPALVSSLRIGRGHLSSSTSLEYVHFSETRTQRSVNVGETARAELVLNRLTPFVTGAYVRTRQRPNLEIDQRVQQTNASVSGGLAIRLGSRFNVAAEVRPGTVRFSNGQYGDAAIADALDRDSRAVGVTTRVRLTPLTTFVVTTESIRDRFLHEVRRDSDSVRILPGFDLKPSALIAGKIAVGYRQVHALSPAVPDFGGLVGHVDARYTLREATLFGLRLDRDLDYSIQDTEPYYITSGGLLDVTHFLAGDWFVAARGGRSALDYRTYTAPVENAAFGVRRDQVTTFGFGFGRRIGDDVRVGFDVNHVERHSIIPSREYQGLRYGVSISYGS